MPGEVFAREPSANWPFPVRLDAPARCVVWAAQGGPVVLRVALFPQLMARLAWFYSLYDGPQSAYVLDILRPLAAAETHVLMMAGFAAGLWIRGKTQQKNKNVF